MKILLIGGSGNISGACSALALRRSWTVYQLNRGRTRPAEAADSSGSPTGRLYRLQADINDEPAVAGLLSEHSFDVVVDFLCFTPEQAASRLRLFPGKTGHYIFLSSASVYRKPPAGGILTEDSPVGNPFWPYAADKLACEGVLRAASSTAARNTGRAFPLTIVRPSHTYGSGWLPTQFGSADFTVAARLLAGLPIPVPGDGQSLWTVTHVRDFAVGLLGLCGQGAAMGRVVNITGDEVLPWDEIYRKLAAALGVSATLVHIPTDFIAAVDPLLGQSLLGDKACSAVFDTGLLRSLVPEFKTSVWLDQGLQEAVRWRRASAERMRTDGTMNARIELILQRWQLAMQGAFPSGFSLA